MSQITSIVINDGKATPVSHTFAVQKAGNQPTPDTTMSAWEDRVSGFVVGYNRISIVGRFPNKSARSTKTTIKITAPVLEVTSNNTFNGIAPAPTVAYTPLATIEFVCPERSSIDSRKDLLAYVRNFLANAAVTAAVVDGDYPY